MFFTIFFTAVWDKLGCESIPRPEYRRRKKPLYNRVEATGAFTPPAKGWWRESNQTNPADRRGRKI